MIFARLGNMFHKDRDSTVKKASVEFLGSLKKYDILEASSIKNAIDNVQLCELVKNQKHLNN